MNKRMKAYHSLTNQKLNLQEKIAVLETELVIKEDNVKYWSRRYFEEELYVRDLNYQIDELRHMMKSLQNKIDLKNQQNQALRLRIKKMNARIEVLKEKLEPTYGSKSIFKKLFVR